jgi:CYTH domain-containing protein
VFKKGYVTEVDVVAQNGKLIVFEVKATAKPSEVDLFTWKVQLVTAQHPTLQVRGVFICLGALPEVKQRCLENALELLS